MEKEQIYQAARGLLQDIADVPMNRFTVGEALFLFRRCLRDGGKKPDIVAAFNEDDLQELIDIVQAVLTRGGKTAIH